MSAYNKHVEQLSKLYGVDPLDVPQITSSELQISGLSLLTFVPHYHYSLPHHTQDLYFVAQNYLLSFFPLQEIKTTLRRYVTYRMHGRTWDVMDFDLWL